MPAWLTAKVLAWTSATLFALVVGLSLAYWAQGVQLEHVENQREKARNNLLKADDTIKAQKQTLQECSDRTDALKAESDRKLAAGAQELARAQQESAKYQGAIKRLEALRAGPVPSGAKCEQAIEAIRRELRK